MSKRLVIGITGASGVILGIRMLKVLEGRGVERHLILSDAGRQNIEIETEYRADEVEAMAERTYDIFDLAAAPASGSFLTGGMVIIPCTIKTLSAIANMYADNLMVRAADVTLKEKRKLVLAVRETPLHRGHLRLMGMAADMGAHILPPVLSFYHRPKTVEDLIDHTIGKTLDCLGVEHDLYRRWG